jgi:hypothetical protein
VARVEFDRLAEDEFCLVPRDWNWIPVMFVLADVCADLGDAENAGILYRQLSPYGSHNAMLGQVYTYGSVVLALGKLAAVLGRLGDAEAHFEAALASNRKIRAAVWLGHTQVELAKSLLRRGEDDGRARAGGLVAAARQTADALGLVRLQRKLDSLDVDGARATAGETD